MHHHSPARVLWLLFFLCLLLVALSGVAGQPVSPAGAQESVARQDPGGEWSVLLVGKNVGPAASLALDSLGYPHVIYVHGGALVYSRYDSSQWWPRVIDIGPVGDFNALRLDSHNFARIAYYDSYNTALKYVKCSGMIWKTEVVDNVGVAGWFISLALDQQENPHLSYYTSTPDYAVKYAHWDGDSWQIETVDASVGAIGGHTSIAIDASGTPSIAYYDPAHGALKYARREGTSWAVETVDGGEVGKFCSLALDSTDRPHISYRDQAQDRLLYASYNDVDWTVEVVDPSGGSYGSLALDDEDRPAIAYYTAPGTALRYAYRRQSWHVEPVLVASSGTEGTSLLLGRYGEPNALYHETTTGNLYYVHRLIWLYRQYLPVIVRGRNP